MLSHANDNRSILLLFNGDDLITGLVLLQLLFISLNLFTVTGELKIFTQTAILFLKKNKSLQNASCLYTLHHRFLLSRRAARTEPNAVIQRGPSETYSLNTLGCRKDE